MSYLRATSLGATSLRASSVVAGRSRASTLRASSPEGVLQVTTGEFPRFPQKSFQQFRTLWTFKQGVTAVFEVETCDLYILKTFEQSTDHENQQTLRRELESLKKMQNVPNIVQIYGVIVQDPPETGEELFQPSPIVGILTEYYMDGTMQDIFDQNCLDQYPWYQWPWQIATALQAFHDSGRTHLDINPANVAINVLQEAVILDLSGIGAMTPGWTAPELRGLDIHPSELSFEAGVWQDTWAFGQLLTYLIKQDTSTSPSIFRHLAGYLMKERSTRMRLSRAIEALDDFRRREENLKRRAESTSGPSS